MWRWVELEREKFSGKLQYNSCDALPTNGIRTKNPKWSSEQQITVLTVWSGKWITPYMWLWLPSLILSSFGCLSHLIEVCNNQLMCSFIFSTPHRWWWLSIEQAHKGAAAAAAAREPASGPLKLKGNPTLPTLQLVLVSVETCHSLTDWKDFT